MNVNINIREFSLISEEHAAGFLQKTLNVFLFPVNIIKYRNTLILADSLKINGKFNIYMKDQSGSILECGKADITEGILSVTNGNPEGDIFIFISFKDKSNEMHQYYSTRKRELVFEKTSFYDTLFILAITPFASASMPVSSPFLGYYMNNDWGGLGLWMMNAPPYLYMEARGLINSPSKLKSRNEKYFPRR